MFTAPSRGAGFTLLELLLVLVLMAVVSSLVLPRLGGNVERARFKSEVRGLISELRGLRGRAVSEGRVVSFEIDPDDQESPYIADARPVVLAESTRLELTAHETAALAAERERQWLEFYPDGSSSGARLVVRNDGQRKVIGVDWLTGAVGLLDHSLPTEGE